MKRLETFTPPPHSLKCLTALVAVLATLLAAPAAAQQQQLVIPATKGTEACTQGGRPELRPTVGSLSTLTKNVLTVNVPAITRRDVNGWEGSVRNSYALRIAVQKNGNGSAEKERNLGTVSSGNFLNAQSVTFSGLENNTRYVVIIYKSGSAGAPYVRHCFKTRGEWTVNPVVYPPGGGSRSGCFAVGTTRQDIKECFCDGRRGGNRIITGADRTTVGCRDTS